MHWAHKLGLEGKDYRKERDNAANIGTMVHEAAEAHIRGLAFEWTGEPNMVERGLRAFRAFTEWAGQTNLRITESEVPLVSEVHRYAGTLDAMLIGGKLALGDWKTSNSIYADYLYQVAAYGILWEENFPERPIEGGYHILRFDKNHGDFGHFHYSDLEHEKKVFLKMRELYDMVKVTEGRVK